VCEHGPDVPAAHQRGPVAAHHFADAATYTSCVNSLKRWFT
jgi:hypothetical protein